MVKCQVDVCSFYFYKYFYFEKNAFDFFRFIKKNFFHCKKALKNSLMVKVTDYSTCKFLKNPATIIKLKYFKKKKIVLNCKNIISSFNFQLSYVLTNFFVGFSYITKIIFYIMFGVNLEYLQAIVFFLKNSHNITKQSIIFFNILVFKKAFSLTSSVFNYTKKAYWLCSGEFFFFQKLFFANFIQTVVKKKNFHICYQFIEICLKALKFFKISSVIIQSIFTKIVMKHELDLFLIKNKKMCFNLFFYKIFQDRLSIVIFFFEKISCFFYYDKPSKVNFFSKLTLYLVWNLKIFRYSNNFILDYTFLKISVNKLIRKINNKCLNISITKRIDEHKIFSPLFFNIHELFEGYTKKKNSNDSFISKERILNQAKKIFLCTLILRDSVKLTLNNIIIMIRLFDYNFFQLNKFKKKSNKRFYNFIISKKKRKRFHWTLCLKIQGIIFFFYKIIVIFLNTRIVFCFSNLLNAAYKHAFKNLMFMKKIYNVSIFIFFKKKIKYFFISHSNLFLFDSIVFYFKIHFNFMYKLIYNQSILHKRTMCIFFYVVWIKICLKPKKKHISHTNCFSVVCLKTLVNISLHFFSLVVYFCFVKKKHIILLLLLKFFFFGFYDLVFLLNNFFKKKKKRNCTDFFKFFFLKKKFKKFNRKFSHNFFLKKISNIYFSNIFNLKKFSCNINLLSKIEIAEKNPHTFFDKKKVFHLKKKTKISNNHVKFKNYIFLSTKRSFDSVCI